MWTEFLLALGRFFQWSFQILPFIGDFMGWLISFIILALLTWWCIKLFQFGSNSEKDYQKNEKFPYL